MNKRTYTEQQYQSGVVQYNVASDILHWLRRSATYQTILTGRYITMEHIIMESNQLNGGCD